MKKAILMKVWPELMAKIINREKTIEIRRTAPKCDLPIDVYLYCTKSMARCLRVRTSERSYVCNDSVVAKFTLKNIEKIKPFSFIKTLDGCLTEKQKEIADKACLDCLSICFLSNGKSVYLWNIENLKIFDEPKKLGEFGLKKAPQSWKFIEME